jgi:hypothetical protein
MLQHMYLKSFTHQSSTLCRKSAAHEINQKYVFSALYWLFVRVFSCNLQSHVIFTPYSPYMPHNKELTVYCFSAFIFKHTSISLVIYTVLEILCTFLWCQCFHLQHELVTDAFHSILIPHDLLVLSWWHILKWRWNNIAIWHLFVSSFLFKLQFFIIVPVKFSLFYFNVS